MDSLVRLGVSSTTATPTDFYNQRFWGFSSLHWTPGLYSLSCSPVVPPILHTCECGMPSPPTTILTMQSASHHLVVHPLCLGCPYLPLLPVWMNVSSLTLGCRTSIYLNFLAVLFVCSFVCFYIGFYPSFGCMRKWSVSTYTSIFSRSPVVSIVNVFWIQVFTRYMIGTYYLPLSWLSFYFLDRII